MLQLQETLASLYALWKLMVDMGGRTKRWVAELWTRQWRLAYTKHGCKAFVYWRMAGFGHNMPVGGVVTWQATETGPLCHRPTPPTPAYIKPPFHNKQLPLASRGTQVGRECSRTQYRKSAPTCISTACVAHIGRGAGRQRAACGSRHGSLAQPGCADCVNNCNIQTIWLGAELRPRSCDFGTNISAPTPLKVRRCAPRAASPLLITQ